jgi:hypothetical protein
MALCWLRAAANMPSSIQDSTRRPRNNAPHNPSGVGRDRIPRRSGGRGHTSNKTALTRPSTTRWTVTRDRDVRHPTDCLRQIAGLPARPTFGDWVRVL